METLFLVKTFVLLFVAKYPFRSWQLLEPPYFMCIFSVVKIWKPKDLSVDEWIRKIYIYIHTHTQWDLYSHKKRNAVIYDNMDGI